MDFFKTVFAGLVGGIIGATIWSVVAQVTGLEIGYVAWGVGVLVGIAIAAINPRTSPIVTGMVGASLAFMGVMGGKVADAYLAMDDFERELITEEFVVSYLADDIVAQREAAGYELVYPAGADFSFPDSEEDYPASVWKEAETEWAALSPAGQEELRADVASEFALPGPVVFIAMFLSSIHPLFDLLWLTLAMGSAWKISSGAAKSEEFVDRAEELLDAGDYSHMVESGSPFVGGPLAAAPAPASEPEQDQALAPMQPIPMQAPADASSTLHDTTQQREAA